MQGRAGGRFPKQTQHLILCRSLPPGPRTRPCIGQQFGQIVSHKYRFRVRTQPRLWAGVRHVLRALLPAERAMAKIMHGPQNTKRPRGATRAAFLVSRPVALTTVVPSQRNHCSGRDARSNAQSQPLNTSEAPWGASLTTQMGHRPWCPFLLWSVSAWML